MKINAKENLMKGGLFNMLERQKEIVVEVGKYLFERGFTQLSGGNKQKVVFGKWIGCGSEILILDCPTRGVDIGVKQAMYQLMVRLKNEGKSILMISEELPELIGMSDRILIMKNGEVSAEFERSETLSDAQIIEYMI